MSLLVDLVECRLCYYFAVLLSDYPEVIISLPDKIFPNYVIIQ